MLQKQTFVVNGYIYGVDVQIPGFLKPCSKQIDQKQRIAMLFGKVIINLLILVYVLGSLMSSKLSQALHNILPSPL